MSPARDLGKGNEPMPTGPPHHFAGDARRSPRLGERGRPHAHCAGAHQHQFDGIPTAADPTDSHDRQPGMRDPHVVHDAHRDGMDALPRQPAAACCKCRTKCGTIDDHPQQGVDQGDGFSARLVHRTGDLDDSVGVGAELGPTGPTAAGGGCDDLGRQVGIVREDPTATLEVRARQVHLDSHHRRWRVGQQVGRSPVVVDRPTPDAGHDGGPSGQQRGKLFGQPMLDAGPLQANGVQHAHACRRQPGRRVARPCIRRQRLRDHGAHRRQVEVCRKFGAVTRRTRGQQHRVGQLD